MTLIERIVAFCCRLPPLSCWPALLLAVGAGCLHPARNFAMNTDSEQLIDAHVGWRMREARFDANFPQQSNLTAGGDRRRHAGTGGSRRRRA